MLHPTSVNFYFIATEIYKNFKQDQVYTIEPVFVMYEDESEYLNVKNWTNARPHDTIKKDIQKLESAIKEQLIEFYGEIQQLLNKNFEFS